MYTYIHNEYKKCLCCDKIFFRPRKLCLNTWNKKFYCSHRCGVIKFPKDKYLQNIFNKIISNSKLNNECIEYTNNINTVGYSRCQVYDKTTMAHRFIYEYFFGTIPQDLNVLHKCDNRKCINIEHLFVGTQSENVIDCLKKQRFKYKNVNRKDPVFLSNEQISEIILMIKNKIPKKEIQNKYNISSVYLWKVMSQNNLISCKDKTLRNINILKLRNDGMFIKDIGEEVNLSQSRVSEIINNIKYK